MHKIFSPIIILVFIASLTACGTTSPSPTTQPLQEPTQTAASESGVVIFADPVLEAMVRGAMGKPEGDITLAEAQAVTRLDLGNELQRYTSEVAPIEDISGLETFTNLETLDLSFHAVTDLSPLAGLAQLTTLSLAGNPIADISSLAGLTDLKALVLTGCGAQDYTPLTNLTNLEYLRLDNSTITDVTPLGSLTSLKYLYLANTPVIDNSPLAEVYPNLVEKDFIVASTLAELGFTMDDQNHQAHYDSETASITINHAAWGSPPMEWDTNIIQSAMYVKDGYKLSVGYYGVHKVYLCQMDKDGEMVMNYIYDIVEGSNNFDAQGREQIEPVIRAAMDVVEGEDVLFAPIFIFNDIIKNEFHMTPDALYAMPFEPPTLMSLGFVPDEVNATWHYEQRGERDVNIEIHRPELGEKDYDFLFFTTLSDEYRMVMTYQANERMFTVGVDDNDQVEAKFDYSLETNEYNNSWCSNDDLKVEEYLLAAFNDPEIEDVYRYPIDFLEQYISDTFGMTFEELYSLPTGE